MLKAIRYTLAAICLAASVGCLALWRQSMTAQHAVCYTQPAGTIWVQAQRGYIIVNRLEGQWKPAGLELGKRYQNAPITAEQDEGLQSSIDLFGRFGVCRSFALFPLWYPALVFALAAVAAICIGRFTLRSALVGMSVCAVLLGMVVVL